MASALILLVLLAGLVTFGWTRARRRLGMNVRGRHWTTTMTVVILGILILWAYTTHR